MGEDEEERELSDSAPVGSFNAVCRKRLTKANGSTKSGKRAVCTLCSACSNYNSGWCADNCDQYGKRVQDSNKNTINIPNGLRNCIAESQPHVPKNCLKDRFRRLEDEDEEERELSDSAPVGSFNAVCQKRLTKQNGSTKSGKKGCLYFVFSMLELQFGVVRRQLRPVWRTCTGFKQKHDQHSQWLEKLHRRVPTSCSQKLSERQIQTA